MEEDKNERKKIPLTRVGKATFIVFSVIFLLAFYLTLDANKYRAFVHIIEGEAKVGVNPTQAALDFGDLSRGTSAMRRVNIDNKTGIPMFIMVFKTGKMSELMEINKNFFRLNQNASEKIEFAAYIPASAEIDKIYQGRVYLFKIPIFF